MGGTYIQGYGFRSNGLQVEDMRYARRHIEKQTGLALQPAQVEELWRSAGSIRILGLPGTVRSHVCVAMVDLLTVRLVGHDWPLNGSGDDVFYQDFISAAIEAGYQVAEKVAA
ncbi:hypothetical protein G6L37_35165 [Agrobacterium rubi]|nr:hypothetical protein [Agrobacterium rubi]NTF23811.1 hypothetical protein [Agrobacterium rubi]